MLEQNLKANDNLNVKDTDIDERMVILGNLTARIAHELNNPLDGMLRYINMSINQLNNGNPEKVPGYLTQVREGLNQLSGMVASLLDFSRKDKVAEQSAEINKIIEDSIQLLAVGCNFDNIIITRDYAQNPPDIQVGNLHGVFSNIIKNAVQASGKKARIEIATSFDSEAITVSIADNGPGIPPEHINSIFRPFFTTKPPGEGTGLGLAICKEIIEKRGGTITAKNRKPSGCIFEIKLPIT